MRFAILLLSGLLFSSCASTNEATESPVVLNATCPISNRPANDSRTAMYGDTTIAFCCKRCVTTFEGKTDEEKKAMAAAAAAEIASNS